VRSVGFELLEHFLAPAPKYPVRSRGAVELLLPALEEPSPNTRSAPKHPPVRADVRHQEPGARHLQDVQEVDFDRINAIVERPLEHFRRTNMPRADTQS